MSQPVPLMSAHRPAQALPSANVLLTSFESKKMNETGMRREMRHGGGREKVSRGSVWGKEHKILDTQNWGSPPPLPQSPPTRFQQTSLNVPSPPKTYILAIHTSLFYPPTETKGYLVTKICNKMKVMSLHTMFYAVFVTVKNSVCSKERLKWKYYHYLCLF